MASMQPYASLETPEISFSIKYLKRRASKKKKLNVLKASEAETTSKSSVKGSIKRLAKKISSKKIRKSIKKNLFRKSKKKETKPKAQRVETVIEQIEQAPFVVENSNDVQTNSASRTSSSSPLSLDVDSDTNRTCPMTPLSLVEISYVQDKSSENSISTVDSDLLFEPYSLSAAEASDASNALLTSNSNSKNDIINEGKIDNNDDLSEESVSERRSKVANDEVFVASSSLIRNNVKEDELVAKEGINAVSKKASVTNIFVGEDNSEDDVLGMEHGRNTTSTIQVPLQDTIFSTPLFAHTSEEQKMLKRFISVTNTLFLPFEESQSNLKRRAETKQSLLRNFLVTCFGAEEGCKDGILD